MDENQEKVMRIEVKEMHGLIHHVSVYEPETNRNLSEALVKCGFATYRTRKCVSSQRAPPQFIIKDNSSFKTFPKEATPQLMDKPINYSYDQEPYQFNQHFRNDMPQMNGGYKNHYHNHRFEKEGHFRRDNMRIHDNLYDYEVGQVCKLSGRFAW